MLINVSRYTQNYANGIAKFLSPRVT